MFGKHSTILHDCSPSINEPRIAHIFSQHLASSLERGAVGSNMYPETKLYHKPLIYIAINTTLYLAKIGKHSTMNIV